MRAFETESTWHEPLSGLDASFLYIEDRTAHMHVGGLTIFEGKAPRYEELVAHVGSRLDRVPRYRQRLAFLPFNLGRPVWIDDSDFDIEYHVSYAALPPPGGDEALKKLAGRLFAQRLDRDKPLWELHLIDGLGENRFALLSKTHHCMVDGVSGVDLASVMLDVMPGYAPPAAPSTWRPRPAPETRELLASSLRDQILHPLAVARGALDPATEARNTLREIAGGMKPLLGITQLGPAPASSLNQPIGSRRRWEMLSMELGAVKRVRAALGGTVNDVVLAIVAGAVRRLLLARGDALTSDLRVLVPVSVRRASERGVPGNQVAAFFCPLPVREPDAVARLRAVSLAMKGLKDKNQAVGAQALTRLSDFAPPTLAAQAARLQQMNPWFNLVVTNVPGPQVPLYLAGRRLLAGHPLVPLAPKQTIGIALLSYNGAINVGLLGDADRARDLPKLAELMRESLEELEALAKTTNKRDDSVLTPAS